MKPILHPLLLALVALVATLAPLQGAVGQDLVATATVAEQSAADEHDMLARNVAGAIAAAIPHVYEKDKDWGRTKNIVVGIRTEGKGLRVKFHRRKKAVNHGVWKRYQMRLSDPERAFDVVVTRLAPAGPGKMAFAMRINANIDAWGRAKVYQLGVHVIALEVVADARVQVEVAGELALRLQSVDGRPALVIDPTIARAAIRFDDFAIRRISNAHGPVVKELGDGVRRLLEDKYDEPALVAKLNRAIDKKQDRLRIEWSPLTTNSASSLSRVTPLGVPERSPSQTAPAVVASR